MIKDYWCKNFVMWCEVEIVVIWYVEFDVYLELEECLFKMVGSYEMFNYFDEFLQQFFFILNFVVEDVCWMFDGVDFELEDCVSLWVIDLFELFEFGVMVIVGFELIVWYLFGVMCNGGGVSIFVFFMGVVLYVFELIFVLLLGFFDGYGVDEENSFELEEFFDDYYKKVFVFVFGMVLFFMMDIEVIVLEKY